MSSDKQGRLKTCPYATDVDDMGAAVRQLSEPSCRGWFITRLAKKGQLAPAQKTTSFDRPRMNAHHLQRADAIAHRQKVVRI